MGSVVLSVVCCPLRVVSGERGQVSKRHWAIAGGPFVGLYDSFVECCFSFLEVNLGYNVLPAREIFASRLFSMTPLAFAGHANRWRDVRDGL